MKQTLLKQLNKLDKMLSMDGYDVDIKLRESHNELLITIKLKEGDIPQILDNWEKVRRYE